MPKHEALTEDELVSAIEYEVAASDYEGQSEISEQRSEADLIYTGQYTRGTYPTTGMSSILINGVQPGIDTVTTYLTNIFCSDQETVVFSTNDEEFAEEARVASEVVNAVIHNHNDGYKILNRWIKDSALHKTGIVKVVWDDSMESTKEMFEGTEEELDIIISERELEGYEVDISSKEKITEVLEVEDEATGDILEIEAEFMKVMLKLSKKKDMPKIINIPPEEFLINEGATDINGDQLTRFVAHRQLAYVSDVMEMFPDASEEELYSSSASGYLEHEFETDIRHRFDGTYDQNDYESTQPNLRQVEIVESWIRADMDGDGFAEWRHCFTVGRTLLMDEEWMGPIPMCSFTFFPIPHKFYGLGLVDKLVDYHIAKTALVRSTIDSAVQANTFRLIADPRQIDVRDLKSGRPGVIKALPGFDPSTVMPLPVNQGNPGATTTMLQYLDREIIAQIGIDPVSGMVSTDVEKSGNDADKTAQVIDNASAKVETFAREFAETGLRDMIWIIFSLLVENGKFPDVGITKDNLKAKVGLGHQTMQQKAAAAQSIIQQQALLEQSPTSPIPIPPKYKLEASKNLAMTLGEEDPGRFFPSSEEIEQAQATQQQQQAQLLQAQQQAAQVGQQDTLQNSEAKRRLEDAKAMEAEVKAQAAQRKQQLEEEAKVVEIDNVKEDNALNVRRQEAQEEQMAANLELQKMNEDLQRELAELKAATAIEVAEIQARAKRTGGSE